MRSIGHGGRPGLDAGARAAREARSAGSAGRFAAIAIPLILGTGASLGTSLAPAKEFVRGGVAWGRYSDRTLSVALTVDRDTAALTAFTVKPRPFERPLESAFHPAGAPDARAVRVEVALLGPAGARWVESAAVRGLCFDHDAGADPHIEGDTIRLHREAVLVTLPELEGFDRIEVSRGGEGGVPTATVPLGSFRLTADRFTAAGSDLEWGEVLFATETHPARQAGEAPLTPGIVHWPEEYGDTDIYKIDGDPDVSRRINIVIVPDGYTYAEKGTMIAHAQSLASFFRSKSPFREHDSFVNYILVPAYSTESGTDQCDCSIVRDTAMNTRFPLITSSCGNSANRCLYYGSGNGGPNCDPNVSTTNIAAAELRAPARDATLIMVNTGRYGGCGGARAVYSAANPSASEIAIHELGHSLGDLADEYVSYTGCGSSASEINTSMNGVTGAWPEWIPELGAPSLGAEYYSSCVYRPAPNCDMRSLGQPFCRVCNQQWALTFFGHPNIYWTAPVESAYPPPPLSVKVGESVPFGAQVRLASYTTNEFVWTLLGPGYPTPTEVSRGAPAYTRSFLAPGTYRMTLRAIADTNFVKPERYGGNVDTVVWSVTATAIGEVSGGGIRQLALRRSETVPGTVDLTFEDVGAARYNLYVSTRPQTLPFAVSDPAAGGRSCALQGLVPAPGGMLELRGQDLGAGIAGEPPVLFVLVTADNGPPTEGSLGRTSSLTERTADSYCSR